MRKRVYEEITDIILSDIKSGKLKPGGKLPAISKMAETYQVSQASIREALNSLKVLDVIQVKHGKVHSSMNRCLLDLNRTSKSLQNQI
ncbi:FadR/GntR family transcriptional regulator [Salinicoccus sp. CNSTN-B1]